MQLPFLQLFLNCLPDFTFNRAKGSKEQIQNKNTFDFFKLTFDLRIVISNLILYGGRWNDPVCLALCPKPPHHRPITPLCVFNRPNSSPPNPKASIHIQKYQFTAGIDTPENIGALSAEPNNPRPSFLIQELPIIYLQRNQMRRVDIVQNISGNIFQDFLWKLFRISSTCANLYSCS